MIARWRITVACALAIAAMPGAAAAYTLDEFASVFRQSCLERLPDGLPIVVGVTFKPIGLLEMGLIAGELTE